MKKLLILSGKGGTGKTTTSAAFIRFSGARAFADCDVDAPNLHLVAEAAGERQDSPYLGSPKARIQSQSCTGCGACLAACRFGAIHREGNCCTVDEYACEGCGVCAYVCPTGAAELAEDVAGQLTLIRRERVFSTARLKMGRGNSGKLVTRVKRALTDAAPQEELAILDGSPGIGCPVIASTAGVDLVLVVAEPSLSGLSDLERLLQTAETLNVPMAVCVNRYDVHLDRTLAIEDFCRERKIPFMGRVPYDPAVPQAVNAGKSVADVECPAREALYQVYCRTMELLEKG